MNAGRNSLWLKGALVLAVALSVGFYLWMSWRTLDLGFPLDDAWIHQSYARNLAQRGEWAFLPGRPSAGSTSPLWAAALSIGHLLGLDPRLWTYALGSVCLVASAWLCARWLSRRCSKEGAWFWPAAALLAFEWHMVWAAVSGMEVLALGMLAVLVLSMLDAGRWHPMVLGALIGVGIWLRPEALLLALPAIWVAFVDGQTQLRSRLLRAAALLLGMMVFVMPYLLFNWSLSGEWWPTTFYAKQAEYAVMQDVPLLRRLLSQFGVPLVGILVMLLPGMALSVSKNCRRRQFAKLAPLIWACAHLAAYAWRLPLTYQHGRYAMPTVPALFVLGMEGVVGWVQPGGKDLLRRVLSRAWLLSIGAVAVCFWYLGARAYGQDVALIESEMVASSRWIAENTEAEALIAAHDIGALGYFGRRDILDLAGLIDPDVIPYIRDEAALEAMLDARQADYLMTFPDWYPQLIVRGEQVFATGGRFSSAAGMESMTVYRWR